jgi:hypothetical protein
MFFLFFALLTTSNFTPFATAFAAAEGNEPGFADSDAESFFDLKATKIDGEEVDFAYNEGVITVITNVASFCVSSFTVSVIPGDGFLRG